MNGEVTALLRDVGGVILSNGWDVAERLRAAQHFQLDLQEMERRHAAAFPLFEIGKTTLAEYLDRTVFWRPRSFRREEFTSYMLAQSRENQSSRAILDAVTGRRRYLQATINNEGLELNAYRIDKFGLTRNFAVFFSSCYVGLRKPDEAIYRLVLGVTQRRPEECLFIDDRPANLESPQRLGMRTIHFRSPSQLRAELARHGISGLAA